MSESVTETSGGAPIVIKPDAAVRLKDEMGKRGDDAKALRLMVFPGGCAGLSYSMAFAKEPEDFEQAFESEGITVYVDGRYLEILDGATISWVDNLIGGGFRVDNPNATSTCGCGKSFG